MPAAGGQGGRSDEIFCFSTQIPENKADWHENGGLLVGRS
jgi:hypothetical protein